MKKGLRLRIIISYPVDLWKSESLPWWKRDYDFSNTVSASSASFRLKACPDEKGITTDFYYSHNLFLCIVWKLALMKKGLRQPILSTRSITRIFSLKACPDEKGITTNYASLHNSPNCPSESLPWWKRDYDAKASANLQTSLTVWKLALMKKGLRLLHYILPFYPPLSESLPWWKRDYDVFRKVMDNMEKKDKEITGLDDSEFFDLFKKS